MEETFLANSLYKSSQWSRIGPRAVICGPLIWSIHWGWPWKTCSKSKGHSCYRGNSHWNCTAHHSHKALACPPSLHTAQATQSSFKLAPLPRLKFVVSIMLQRFYPFHKAPSLYHFENPDSTRPNSFDVLPSFQTQHAYIETHCFFFNLCSPYFLSHPHSNPWTSLHLPLLYPGLVSPQATIFTAPTPGLRQGSSGKRTVLGSRPNSSMNLTDNLRSQFKKALGIQRDLRVFKKHDMHLHELEGIVESKLVAAEWHIPMGWSIF